MPATERVEDTLADFTRDKRVVLLCLMAIVIGVISAGVAQVLVWLIAVITNLCFFQEFSSAPLSPENNQLGYLVIFVPVIGGLIIGLMARFGSEKIRGHGIPEALEAILFGRSRMEPKVAVLKPLSSAISIGTGGPFGAEGPIIMTGGAIGSLLAQLIHLSSAERKTLLVAGAAAGMSAIFASPVAAVLLAVELLLFEWRPRSFIPVAIAAAVAGAVRVPLLGSGPIFPVVPHDALGGYALLAAAVIGLLAGLLSGLLTLLVYQFEDLFEKLPIHWMWWPAIGGLAVGIGGIVEPQVLGVGYDTIHDLLRGQLVGVAVIALLFSKAVVWSIALGSGTSGGVLAPLLMMGGAMGALVAPLLPIGDAGLWATIGMAAMMGGTMRSPLTSMVFALELTHDLNLLPALLVGCIMAHALTVLLLRRSILTEKVARRGYHIAREYSVDPLAGIRVGEVMDCNVPVIPSSIPLAELSERLARRDPQLGPHHAHLLVDEEGALVGIVTRGDIVRALDSNPGDNPPVMQVASHNLIVTYPDEILQDAVAKMVRNSLGRLPVVSREKPNRPVGYLGRSNVLSGRLRSLEDEQVRERGLGGRVARPAHA